MKYALPMILALAMVFIAQSPDVVAAHQPPSDDCLKSWLEPIAVQAAGSNAARKNDPRIPLARFYRQLDYRPAWTGTDGLLPQGEILMQVMEAVAETGFFPEGYRPPFPAALNSQQVVFSGETSLPRLAPHVQLDVMLSNALLQMARQLSRGWIAPEAIYGQWLAWHRPPAGDITVKLARAVKQNRLVQVVAALHPQNPAYQRLIKALKDYQRIHHSGGWPVVAPGPTLRYGDTGTRVEALKRRLAITGDENRDRLVSANGFDAIVESAVKHFQHRHGLRADGIVGKRTLAELNVPVKSRITSLKLNMERWRWFPDDWGDRHVMVNIPAFMLRIVIDGQAVDHMRAIVGREDRQTPVMSGRLTYLEFNPYWNIPQKIARRDILPRTVNDPDYLTRQGIRVYDTWNDHAQELDPWTIAWETLSDRHFPYRLRQDPSKLNALGRIKFMFPNPHSVYIHDTPAKTLFSRRERDFSSGCVRVETPRRLAYHLLNSQGWNPDRLKTAVDRGKHRTVLLDEPIPVHLVYFTAWVAEDGRVNFRQDIYGRDRQLLLALTQSDPDALVCVNDENADQLKDGCALAPTRYISIADTPRLEPAASTADNPTAGL